jgi:GNAT superfamily N-acetyltransferase
MSPNESIVIRAATERDAVDIHRLIGELADYEKLRHEATGGVDALRAHLFGTQPFAHALMAHADGQLAGFALYFHNYSTFLCRPGIYLEDLFVRPAFRGRGVGKRLLAHLARHAVAMGCGRLEWAVLDWNTPSIEFYRRLGAAPLDEWTTFRVTGDALTRLAATGTVDPATTGPRPQA